MKTTSIIEQFLKLRNIKACCKYAHLKINIIYNKTIYNVFSLKTCIIAVNISLLVGNTYVLDAELYKNVIE